MKTRLQKWGNSLGIRISKPLADEMALREGSEVEITFSSGKIMIEPIGHRYRLPDLLNRITDENLHDEIGAHGPRGREIW